jgi:glycosyltransferase involved in cell wall biosynthesis
VVIYRINLNGTKDTIRMRVVHVIKIIRIAGAEQHLLTLLAGLRQQDIDARFLMLVEPGTPMDDFMQAAAEHGIPVKRMTIYHHADPTLLVRLARRLRALRPDIVHTHLLHADLYGIPAARLARVPVVIASRHNDNTFRRKAPFKQINRALWAMCDAGIAISAAITRFTIEVEGAAPAQMHTILYGLDPAAQIADRAGARADLRAELGLPADAILPGMVCRLIEQKGIPYALRAFQQIAASHPTAHLILVGEGDQRPALEALTAELGLTERVHFLGWRTDTAHIYAALDVFLMPSLWEGFGLVLLEAMAQSLPVVGSRVSAIPEVVADGETGILCPPRDIEALAAALDGLLADADRRAAMGAAGHARLVTVFNPARMVAETVQVYQQTLHP